MSENLTGPAPSEASKRPHFLCDFDIAAILGLHVKTVRKWRIKGFGPAWVKIGGAVRYPPDSFDAFLRELPRQRVTAHTRKDCLRRDS